MRAVEGLKGFMLFREFMLSTNPRILRNFLSIVVHSNTSV
jgi:hypothetical protein